MSLRVLQVLGDTFKVLPMPKEQGQHSRSLEQHAVCSGLFCSILVVDFSLLKHSPNPCSQAQAERLFVEFNP